MRKIALLVLFVLCITACNAEKTENDKPEIVEPDNVLTLSEKLAEYAASLPEVKEFLFESVLQSKELTTDNISLDFDNNGKTEILRLSLMEIEASEDEPLNLPINLKMEINNSSINYINNWNDNIYMCVTDFDIRDNFLDIYIHSTSTGPGCDISEIYRYDGEKIYKYLEFGHYTGDLYYDEKGEIYFVSQPIVADDGIFGFPKISVIDYNTKESRSIE